MEVKVVQDNKISILDDFLGKDEEIVNSDFQKGRYAKKLRLLANGVLPKEYRVKKHVYSRGEYLEYVEQQVEHVKTTKIKRRISHGN